ncbi:hypothetical protein DSM3645_13056 [Blastopirellula marina DSM 3645]|uniref:Uncharacterized protein n=1 Tax=Blastopirellula marina DSM 3645 TaxID=314230 RepID=A3ZS27_9BACT|nr:hypothetical protein DSM3645_13056 [Blastopirellula marina DSM 3645]
MARAQQYALKSAFSAAESSLLVGSGFRG